MRRHKSGAIMRETFTSAVGILHEREIGQQPLCECDYENVYTPAEFGTKFRENEFDDAIKCVFTEYTHAKAK